MNAFALTGDVHDPQVKRLAQVSDWAALARYSLAHQHGHALEEAIRGAKLLSDFDHRWAPLQTFLEHPYDYTREIPEELLPLCNDTERISLRILQLYPRALFCDKIQEAPIQFKKELLHIGVQAAQSVVSDSLALGDSAMAAAVLAFLARGERELGNVNQVFTAWKQCLDLYEGLAQQRPEVYTEYVAITLSSLACVESDMHQFQPACNTYEMALAAYNRLGEHRRKPYLPHIAGTLSNLGELQMKLGSYASARKTFENLVGLERSFPREAQQAETAKALYKLGSANDALNEFEQALSSYEEALAIRHALARDQPAVFRPLVANTLNNLGIVLINLNQPEKALERYEEAFRIYSELAQSESEVYSADVAMVLTNIGNAKRAVADFESARESYQFAFRVYRKLKGDQQKMTVPDAAKVLNNLAAVQCELNDLQGVCAALADVVELWRQLAQEQSAIYSPYLASTLMNLGAAERAINRVDKAAQSVTESLDIFRQLAIQQPKIYRIGLARALDHLGGVAREQKDFQSAQKNYTEALSIYRALLSERPETFRAEFARTLYNHGCAHAYAGDRRAALAVFEESSQHYAIAALARPIAYLRERCQLGTNLGELYRMEDLGHDRLDFRRAREALREAVKCTTLLRDNFRDEKLRKFAQEQGSRSYQALLCTCVDLWDNAGDLSALQEAVTVAERSRARNLVDRLHGTDLSPANAPAALVDAFRELRRKLQLARVSYADVSEVGGATWMNEEVPPLAARLRMLGNLESTSTVIDPSSESRANEQVAMLRAEVERLEREVAACLSEVRRHDPDYNPEGVTPTLSFEQIQQLVPVDVPTAFVQFAVTRDETVALVTTRTEVFPIRLKELSDHRAWQLAREWFESYYNNASKPTLMWETMLPVLLEKVGAVAARPLAEPLAQRGLRRLIISPNRGLSVFPLHACRLTDNRYFGERFEIVYTPSLSVLGHCAQRDRPGSGDMLLVGNPTCDLRFADAESAALRHRYPRRTELLRSAATKRALLEAAGSSWLLHYTGHSTFNVSDQLESGLLLAGDRVGQAELLTLREVFAGLNLRRNFLTILNGCESGMLRPDLADEYVSLPTGFLYAGAVCVVSTLWTVHDISAALLMDHFHAEWQSGRSIAAALREAARWLREDIRNGHFLMKQVLPEFLKNVEDAGLRERCEETARAHAAQHPDTPPFASPVYWAPFIATGLAYPARSTGIPAT